LQSDNSARYRPRLGRIGVGLAAAAMFATGITTQMSNGQVGAVPAATTGGTEFGSSVGGGNLAQYTSQFGHMPVVRVYNSGLPQPWPGNAGANNSDVAVSFKALPRTVLSGADDAALTAFFRGAPTNHTVWWTYFHEPENDIASGSFTAADYRAAWVHIAALARAVHNPRLNATLILMSYTLNPVSHRNFDDYYPGGSVIDTLGWDGYPVPRTSPVAPAIFMGPAVAKSRSLGKPFAFAEFGMTSATGRAAWLTSVAAYLRANGAVYGTYFNATVGGNYVLTDAASQAAWRAVVASSGTGPQPSSTPRPTSGTPRPTSTPVPPTNSPRTSHSPGPSATASLPASGTPHPRPTVTPPHPTPRPWPTCGWGGWGCGPWEKLAASSGAVACV
jgi:hypothetical protein